MCISSKSVKKYEFGQIGLNHRKQENLKKKKSFIQFKLKKYTQADFYPNRFINTSVKA